jgi:rhodanese-related sulfurtransferase
MKKTHQHDHPTHEHHDHDHDHPHDHSPHTHEHHNHDHDDDYNNEYDVYPKEFISMYESPTFVGSILDVRDEWEYEQLHIENSTSIPLRKIAEHVNKLDRDGLYYVICSQGIRSSFAAEFLLSCGFTRVYNIQTGIMGISETVDAQSYNPSWLKP